MDRTNVAILKALQADSARPIAETAERLGMSLSACHRRIKALEEKGVIAGYAARLDPRRLGISLEIFVEITLTNQRRETMVDFEEAVFRYDEILECHLKSGSGDYLLRVAARDVEHFDRIHRDCLSQLPAVSAMHSSFAIRAIKRWHGYPVEHAG